MRQQVLALAIGFATFGAMTTACKSEPTTEPVSPAISDVIMEGSATPQALTALLDAKIVDDPSLAANFSWQSAGDELPVTPIPIFCWHIGSSEANVAPTPFLSPRRAVDSRPKSAWNRAASALVRELLDGVPEAQAAPATNGLGYFLVFSTDHDPKLIRVFTTGTEYTPNQAAWDKITHAGELVHVRVTNASFDNNKLASGGGPFQGAEISFTFPVM